MAIVKVKLMKQYQRKDGTSSIVIYVNEKKPQYVYTGYAVRPDQFVDGQSSWVKKHPDAVVINAKVEDMRRNVIDSIIPGIGYIEGAATLADGAYSFCEYLRYRAEQYGSRQQEDMRLKCNRMAFELSQVRGRDIYCHEINTDFIREFQIWCEKNGNSNNTVMRKIKNLRYLYSNAISDGKTPGPNPFTNFKLKFDKVNVSKLTIDEIKIIGSLPLAPGTTIDHVRNAFLFSFYAQGMRFERVITLTWDNVKGKAIEYENNKGSADRRIRITPQLEGILRKYAGSSPYIFPFIKRPLKTLANGQVDKIDLRNLKGAASVLVNEYLKIIGDMAGIKEPLHFHKARHSFSYAAKKKGVDVAVISDALGHSDTKITQAYLDRLDDDFINDALSSVWE